MLSSERLKVHRILSVYMPKKLPTIIHLQQFSRKTFDTRKIIHDKSVAWKFLYKILTQNDFLSNFLKLKILLVLDELIKISKIPLARHSIKSGKRCNNLDVGKRATRLFDSRIISDHFYFLFLQTC